MLPRKRTETFWSKNVTDIRVLAYFESKINEYFKTISGLCVLNCFKYFLIYILGQNVSKKIDKKSYQKKYVKSSCARLFEIFSNAYFQTKCLKKFRQETFLNYIGSSCITFCVKIFQHFHIV